MKTVKETFPTLLSYIFDPDHNEEYAFAPHVKLTPATNPAFAGEVMLVALNGKKEIERIFAFDGASALDSITVEYLSGEEEVSIQDAIDDCLTCQDRKAIAVPGESYACRTHQKMIDEMES